jgi:hypothetical protein
LPIQQTAKLKYTFFPIAIGANVAGNSRRKLLIGYTFLGLILAPLWLVSERAVFLLYPTYTVLFLAMGILTGAAFGHFSEKRIVKIIEKQGEYGNSSVNRGLAALLIVIGVLLVVPSILSIVLFVFLLNNLSAVMLITQAVQLSLLFIVSMMPTAFATQAYTVKRWEKKNQMEILYDFGLFTGRIYAAPFPPSFPPPKPEAF